jgi:hypothetical protein
MRKRKTASGEHQSSRDLEYYSKDTLSMHTHRLVEHYSPGCEYFRAMTVCTPFANHPPLLLLQAVTVDCSRLRMTSFRKSIRTWRRVEACSWARSTVKFMEVRGCSPQPSLLAGPLIAFFLCVSFPLTDLCNSHEIKFCKYDLWDITTLRPGVLTMFDAASLVVPDPQLKLYQNGKEIDQYSGDRSHDHLAEYIKDKSSVFARSFAQGVMKGSTEKGSGESVSVAGGTKKGTNVF